MSKNIVPIIRFKSFLNHWSYTGLKEIKDVRDGTHSSPKYIDNGYPLVTSKNLTDSGLNLNDVSLISESDYNEINKRSKVKQLHYLKCSVNSTEPHQKPMLNSKSFCKSLKGEM